MLSLMSYPPSGRSDDGSNFDRAITFGSDNGFNELVAITFHNCAEVLCDNATWYVALWL